LLQNRAKLNFLRKIFPRCFKEFLSETILFKNSSKPVMTKNSRNYLLEIFSSDIKSLEVLLNRNIDAWK